MFDLVSPPYSIHAFLCDPRTHRCQHHRSDEILRTASRQHKAAQILLGQGGRKSLSLHTPALVQAQVAGHASVKTTTRRMLPAAKEQDFDSKSTHVCWSARPKEKVRRQGFLAGMAFIMFKLSVACSSDCPPLRKTTPGTCHKHPSTSSHWHTSLGQPPTCAPPPRHTDMPCALKQSSAISRSCAGAGQERKRNCAEMRDVRRER